MYLALAIASTVATFTLTFASGYFIGRADGCRKKFDLYEVALRAAQDRQGKR